MLSSHTGQGTIFISISDTGPGIPPEAMDRIFEPFFTTKETGMGTGLGLAVSFSLVEKMGGNISVENTTGQGATFTIEIPITDTPNHD